ncbi:hypothetical protein IOD16_34405 [Saccharothrix sp. 6-C]|uniref:DUF3093 family protein n=1 Tax=Saccharothrix texasensis TaxID=103734 RepID=A0A3N1HB57_9PSEU|nr:MULTISPECIES: hypothetical protein [Saccharothrix]QQQ76082.1 hypothetical protein IOD16_34405 [Saccharothrix sp. 6-C]ROP39735.1 hypothetical protein EDD40_5132 [Saccharothrix texasensis]
MDQPILYAESGTSWWPLLWGPVFAALGFGVEASTGAARPLLWLVVALVLLLPTALWVQARRRLYQVRLTPVALRQGREELRLGDVEAVEGVEPRAGVKVLGGAWTLPRGTTAVPLRLVGGEVVMGWARDADALRAEIAKLVSTRA